MMESGSECRQPYTLSNLDFVTQSFTLMAGNRSSPLAAISFKRWTPVVVSSLTPWHFFAILLYLVLQAAILGILLLELFTLVNQKGCITAIIHEQIAAILARHGHHLLSAPPVLGESFTLPCENCGCAGLGNRCRSMVLGAENVA